MAGLFVNGGIIGKVGFRCPGIRRLNKSGLKKLWRLHQPEGLAVYRFAVGAICFANRFGNFNCRNSTSRFTGKFKPFMN